MAALCLLQGAQCLSSAPPPNRKTARELVALIAARSKQIRSLRAETRMTHRSQQGKVRATVRLMAEREKKMRFDAVSPFDTPMATLVSNGARFVLIDAKKNTYYYGPASPCNIARLIGVVLEADEILAILGGSTPLIDYDTLTLDWDGRGSAEVLTLHGKQLSQTIRLDGHSLDLLESEIKDRDGHTILSIKDSKSRRLGRLRVPMQISIQQPKHNADLDITFKHLELNIELPKQAFQLPEPNGLTPKEVQCDTTF